MGHPILEPKTVSERKQYSQLITLFSIGITRGDCYQNSTIHSFPPIPFGIWSWTWIGGYHFQCPLSLDLIPSSTLTVGCSLKHIGFADGHIRVFQTDWDDTLIKDQLYWELIFEYPLPLLWSAADSVAHPIWLVPLPVIKTWPHSDKYSWTFKAKSPQLYRL